ALLDVDLEQVAQVVHARTPLAEQALLLDAGGLRITLRHDQPPELVPEFTRHFLPDGLSEEITKADSTIVDRVGEKNPPAVFGQLDVLEMRPPFGIDADRRPDVHLVIVLEALRAHVLPPLDVFGLPVLERTLEPLVAGEVDVIGDLLGGNHSAL